ncbi:MAG: SRPBCC domain-containing protein [Acidobacteria bacterium]|nr:SRPBCC domain-containing protein [Acidobacteriota bacterium]
MADIYQDFPIKSPVNRVYDAVSTSHGLDLWWTKRSSGQAKEGAEFSLWFGPDYDWRAKVTRAVPGTEFELQVVKADPDWLRTRVGFRLEDRGATTQVHFYHEKRLDA